MASFSPLSIPPSFSISLTNDLISSLVTKKERCLAFLTKTFTKNLLANSMLFTTGENNFSKKLIAPTTLQLKSSLKNRPIFLGISSAKITTKGVNIKVIHKLLAFTSKLIRKKVTRLELNTIDTFVPIKVVAKNLSGFKIKS